MKEIIERPENELLREKVEALTNVLVTLLQDLANDGIITTTHSDYNKLVHEQKKMVKD